MRRLACTVGAALLLAGCIGGGEDGQPAGDPRKRSADGAEAAAADAFESYAAADYGGFWDAWVADAQELISRDDYVKGMRECAPVAQGWPFHITSVNVTDDGDVATVKGERAARDIGFLYRFRYLEGRWRFDPFSDQRAAYQAGYDAWLEFMRSRGACSSPSASWMLIY